MGWQTQDSNPDAKVQVNGGYVRDPTAPLRTDFLIIDKTGGQITKTHLSVDLNGNMQTWTGPPLGS